MSFFRNDRKAQPMSVESKMTTYRLVTRERQQDRRETFMPKGIFIEIQSRTKHLDRTPQEHQVAQDIQESLEISSLRADDVLHYVPPWTDFPIDAQYPLDFTTTKI